MANSAERTATSAGCRARRPRLTPVVASAVLVIAVLTQLWIVPEAVAGPTLQSTGSSFASVAIQEWVGQSATLYGLNINWQVTSSVIGLNNFAANQVDVGASDIPYSSGQAQSNPTIPYQYMPDVAGGLAFMYNLNGNDGNRITNLVLNASAVAKIFLGKIVKWNDPVIAQLNPQLAGDLPSTQIIAVYRSDASGENYLLSDYLLHQDGSEFTSAQNTFGSPLPGQPDANWPTPPVGQGFNNPAYPGWDDNTPTGANGSDNAANYVAGLSSLGAITYVETAYAKEHNFPVASLLNASGAAVQPTSVDVATALEAAILHPDLTQDLTNVYTNPLPNAYPLSAYSYLVSPCSPQLAAAQKSSCAADPGGAPSTFPSEKGQVLGQFVSYLACLGQDNMADLGYSPLPPNLVQEDFDAVGRLNGGQELPPVSPADCKNPYVDGQTPLPGEPAIQGQAGGGVAAPTGSAAGASASAAGSAAGPGGSAGGGSAGGSGGGSGSGSVSAALAAAGLTAAQAANGYTVVNGKIVRTLAAGPNKYQRADALLAATGSVYGPRNLAVVGGVLLVLALVLAPPVIASQRRRRTAGEAEDAAPSMASPDAEP